MGEAVRKGMDPYRALMMATINPAKILDIDHRVGSLKEGKDADVLIWSDLPTKRADANLEMIFVDGKLQK